MAETCSTCRFWKAYPRSDGAPPMAGLCRALPPNMAGMWPDTRAVDWCGVYAAPVSSVVAVAPVATPAASVTPETIASVLKVLTDELLLSSCAQACLNSAGGDVQIPEVDRFRLAAALRISAVPLPCNP